jgi:hypothetical protein
MKNESKILRTNGSIVTFHYKCSACEAEGELDLDRRDGMKSFGCPAGCGATYVPIQDRLECVVLPVNGINSWF